MRKLDSEKENALREKMLEITMNNKYNQMLGLEVMELSHNYGKTRIKYCEEMINPYGSFHGGALLSMADVTAGITACMGGYFVTTVTSHLNFLSEAKNTEYIYCECMKLKAGRHISVYDIRITDDKGKLLDSGEFSFFASKVSVI